MKAFGLPARGPYDRALAWLRLAYLPAVAASAALTVEYRSIESSFCAPDSGCSVLRRTDLATLWGVGPTLPELGLVLFSLLYLLTLTRARGVSAALSIPGGLLGALLLASQAITHGTFCWLCVVVDVSALGAAAFAVAYWLKRRRSGSEVTGANGLSARASLGVAPWVGLLVLAVLGPMLWPSVKPAPPVPAAVRAYYKPNKINVVEFSDFQCPFCRRLHHDLKQLLKPYADQVNFVRLNMPLPRHPRARDAALAAICAEPSGHAEQLIEFMFSSEDLSLSAIRGEAARLGIDLTAFDRCRSSSEAETRLERESRILPDVGFQGLPTTYIGGKRIVGAGRPETFQDAIEQARQDDAYRGVPAWVYLLILGAIATALVRFGRTSDLPKGKSQVDKTPA